MKVVCIVPSAGKGRRLKCKQDKPFVMLGDKPLLSRTLKVLEDCPIIDKIIVVVSDNKLKTCKKLIKKYKIDKIGSIVRGGKKRLNSVRNALVNIGEADYILIHDGVRPFIDQNLIKKVFAAARKTGAALCAIPCKQTLKLIGQDLFIIKTPNRKSLWEAQTPQVFRKDLIVEAYKKAKDQNATDDASLVERLGHKVKIVKGSYRNIKVTTPEDLLLAKALVKYQC